jgi:methionyl-tRNA formyltransferase
MNVRTAFMGSPEFALPALRLLAESYPVVGVFTQPDRPKGRGRNLAPPPVKILANDLDLPVFQYQSMRETEAMEVLRRLHPELIVVAAFGQILKQEVLDLPRYGCINVHASLLPRWRGAAPIQAAILNGDDKTGATIMRMDAGVDTGPILSQRPLLIRPDDTAGALSERLAQAGAELLIETLPGYIEGKIEPRVQETFEVEPTYAPMLKKEDGLLDFSRSAKDLERQVRAFNPWPGAYFIWLGNILKIHRARPIEAEDSSIPPGKTLISNDLPAVSANPGVLLLEEVQPPGKKPMEGSAFLLGARHWT